MILLLNIEKKLLAKMLNIDTNHSIISLYKKKIIFSFFIVINEKKNQACILNFYASSSFRLFEIINNYKSLFSSISLDHILYIGQEVYKAELSQLLKQRYVQS